MDGQGLFQAHIELFRDFLRHREHIVERIESLLNAQRKPGHYRGLLSQHFEDCFFERAALAGGQSLRGQLEKAHWAAGFKPRQVQHVYNDLIHPAELMIRAVHCWQQTRWPGQNGRTHYAHTLFNLYVVRCLAFLSMRIWDDDSRSATTRLAGIQTSLDELWKNSPADQPMFVRDARWLIPLAQSLITDELAPYLENARLVAETLPKDDVLEIQKVYVRMLGGHLASQIRYYCTKDGLTLDDSRVVGRTRTSNALDFALLIQGLVGLLKAYERALLSGDEQMRLDMAAAICQGIAPDPELFLNRFKLLGAYSMIEHVFIATDSAGHVAYSALGERHSGLLEEYRTLIDRLRDNLRDDASRFRPVRGGFSPYGVLFGIPTNLIEHMALKAIDRDAETRFSLEDIFDNNDSSAAKLAWVNGWRKLPHIDPEVQQLYAYPQEFAEEIFSRIERELTRNDSKPPATGRLYIGSETQMIPELPARYFVAPDKPIEKAQLLRDRQEAHFLVSYETPAGWVALKKDLLSEVLAAGRDTAVTGLPPNAAQVLRLMCIDVVT